jgi:hypothetical protein
MDPGPHQSDKLDPDPHQCSDGKLKCMKYEVFEHFIQGFEPQFGS